MCLNHSGNKEELAPGPYFSPSFSDTQSHTTYIIGFRWSGTDCDSEEIALLAGRIPRDLEFHNSNHTRGSLQGSNSNDRK